MQDTREHVRQLEARHDARLAVTVRDGQVGVRADDHADVAGAEEAVDGHLAAGEQRVHGGDDELVPGQEREVLEAALFRFEHGDGGCWRRGLEAHGEEDDLALGLLLGDAQRVAGRVDDGHVRAVAAHLLQAAEAAGHAQHVAVGDDGHVRTGGQLAGGVEVALAGHADRAAPSRRCGRGSPCACRRPP